MPYIVTKSILKCIPLKSLLEVVRELLRGIFGPELNEVTGVWRRADIKKLYELYSSPFTLLQDEIKGNEMGGHVASVAGNNKTGNASISL